MKTVKLITCNDAIQAHILQGALENEGIDSVLHNENFSNLYRGFVSNIAGVDIFVVEEDYEKAIQVLKDNQSWPEELKFCPHCGSSDIKFVLKKTNKMRTACATVFSMLAASPPGNVHWEYVCHQCHERFEKPISKIKSAENSEEPLVEE